MLDIFWIDRNFIGYIATGFSQWVMDITWIMVLTILREGISREETKKNPDDKGQGHIHLNTVLMVTY